jgi:hypothetical protein
MGINRYMNYVPTDWNIKPYDFPVEALYNTLDKLQAKSDQNYGDLNVIPDMIKANALDPDKGIVTEVQKSFQDRIDKLIASGNGDYSQMGKDVVGLKRDLKNEMTKGRLKAVEGEYNRFQANKESLQKQYEKGDISADDLQRGLSYSLGNYKGIGQIDPVTGIYNTYKDLYIPKFNADKTYDDALDKVKPDSLKTGQWSQSPDGRWFMKNTVSNEVLSEDKLFNGTLGYVANNKEYNDYARFQDMIGNKDFKQQTLGAIGAKARLRSYTKQELDQDMKYNQALADDLSEAGRNRRHAEKQAQDQMLFGPQVSGVMPIDINNFNAPADPIDFTKEISANNFMENKRYPLLFGEKTLSNSPLRASANKENLIRNSKNQTLDENHPAYKDNHLYQAALSKTKSQLANDYKNVVQSKNPQVKKDYDAKLAKQLTHNYELLNRTQNFNNKGSAMSADKSEEVGNQVWQNRHHLVVQEIDENGKPSGRKLKLNGLAKFDEDGAKMVRDGKIGGITSTLPITTGVFGTVFQVGGKRYISEQLIPKELHPVMEREAQLGRDLLINGKKNYVQLPYLNNGTPMEITTEILDDGQVVLKSKDVNGKSYAPITFGDFTKLSQQFHEDVNPMFMDNRRKEKDMQFQRGNQPYSE